MSSKKLGRPVKKRGTMYRAKPASFVVVAKLNYSDEDAELFLAALCVDQMLRGTVKEWSKIGTPAPQGRLRHTKVQKKMS